MLDMKHCVTFTGTSKIEDKAVERFTASINADNPEDMQLGEIVLDKDMYRDNRDQCHEDQAEFENVVYAAQAEMFEVDAKKEG